MFLKSLQVLIEEMIHYHNLLNTRRLPFAMLNLVFPASGCSCYFVCSITFYKSSQA